jgi:very-short-patch-repair endonuclease
MAGRHETWRTEPELWRKLKPVARTLRNEPTRAEAVLWQHIRRGALGASFRRQHALDRFIVDFYAPEVRLAIEVDGDVHDTQREQDAVRQQHLERLGVRFLRFRNEEVLGNTARVTAEIAAKINELKQRSSDPTNSPSLPSGEGAGGRGRERTHR